MRSRVHHAVAGCLSALTLLSALASPAAAEPASSPAEGMALSAGSLPPGTPPPPKGYKSPGEVMAAIALKQVKLINLQDVPTDGVVETKNLEYGKVGERSLQLDLYQPANLQKAVPGLIFIHGGAWSGGSRDIYKYYTVRFARRGYVAATVSYRLSGEAPFPAAVEDVKCAVRWLRANAARWHIDPNKLAALGGSAGGHLSLMLGYSPDARELEGAGGNPGTSSRVQAVVDFYGPFDLTTPFAQTNGAVRKFLAGKNYDEARDLYRQASPVQYLKAGAPPTLIFHGSIDDVVPIDQADALAGRLKQLRVPFIYDRLEGWPHTLDLAAPVNERCQWLIDQFLARHLPLPAP